jgi:hypothetical protein
MQRKLDLVIEQDAEGGSAERVRMSGVFRATQKDEKEELRC